MPWTKKDKILFNIVNQFGEKHLEDQIDHASNKFLTLKKRPHYFVIFGIYNLDQNIFIWQNDMNKFSYDFVLKNYMSLFKTDKTLKRLFTPQVNFDEKDMNVIPYLMEALNAQFSVLRFKSPKANIYALTIMDEIKETFKYEEFNDAMFLYRFDDNVVKKTKDKRKKRQIYSHPHKIRGKERV